MHVIVLRGPAGAGKSTLAIELQNRLGYPTAHLDTDVLNWQFVPGEPNKQVVFDLLRQLTSGYLSHGYHVIIAGTIPVSEERGALRAIKGEAESQLHRYCEFFCDAPLATCLSRAADRERDIAASDIERWWHESRQDLRELAPRITVLDMAQPVENNIERILALTSL